jgi:hypothetical protein
MADRALVLRLSKFSIVSVLAGIGGLASAQAANPAVTAADRLKEPWWAKRHSQVLEQIQSNPNAGLVLLGDSITQNYEKSRPPDEDFQPTWRQPGSASMAQEGR